jgi:hypothetical protein
MAVAILYRANRRLNEAMAEMNGAQQEQTVRQMESARRELARMAARIGKETESKHAELAGVYCERTYLNNAEIGKLRVPSSIACGINVRMCITPFWVGNTT